MGGNEGNVGSVNEEVENSTEDGVNDADTNIMLQEEDENNDNDETEETEECEEKPSEVRRVGLRPKRSVTYDHRYDHTMTIILSQMSLGKGIKAFGDRAVDTTTKEFSQLDEKGVLIPKHFNELSKEERDEALPVVVLIKEKRSGEIKGRPCTDGRKQRLYIPPEDTNSPTVSTESLFLSCLIDAVEKRSVATCDIMGVYLNAEMVDKVYIVIRQK